MFLPSSLRNYIIPSPFSLVDIYLPIILSRILTGLALVFIIFTPISASSKHSVPGSIRIIPQLIPLELIFTTILLLTIRSWNDPSLRTMFLEFHRIPNHSSAITTHAIDTGLWRTLTNRQYNSNTYTDDYLISNNATKFISNTIVSASHSFYIE